MPDTRVEAVQWADIFALHFDEVRLNPAENTKPPHTLSACRDRHGLLPGNMPPDYREGRCEPRRARRACQCPCRRRWSKP